MHSIHYIQHQLFSNRPAYGKKLLLRWVVKKLKMRRDYNRTVIQNKPLNPPRTTSRDTS